jgi:hypothetical protein
MWPTRESTDRGESGHVSVRICRIERLEVASTRWDKEEKINRLNLLESMMIVMEEESERIENRARILEKDDEREAKLS